MSFASLADTLHFLNLYFKFVLAFVCLVFALFSSRPMAHGVWPNGCYGVLSCSIGIQRVARRLIVIILTSEFMSLALFNIPRELNFT